MQKVGASGRHRLPGIKQTGHGPAMSSTGDVSITTHLTQLHTPTGDHQTHPGDRLVRGRNVKRHVVRLKLIHFNENISNKVNVL